MDPATIFSGALKCMRELRFAPANGQSRVREEYLADLEIVARRNLDMEEFLFFRTRFLRGQGSPPDARAPAVRRLARQLGSAFLREGLVPAAYFRRSRGACDLTSGAALGSRD